MAGEAGKMPKGCTECCFAPFLAWKLKSVALICGETEKRCEISPMNGFSHDGAHDEEREEEPTTVRSAVAARE